MSFYNYYLKGYFFTDISEIEELRKRNLIGAKLKKGLLTGTIIEFKSRQLSGAVQVKVEGSKCVVRHVRPSKLHPKDAELCAYNIAYTMYQDYPVEYNPEPIYSEDEVGVI